MFLVHMLLCFFLYKICAFILGIDLKFLVRFFKFMALIMCSRLSFSRNQSVHRKQMSSLCILLHLKFYIIPQKVLPELVFRTLKIALHILDDLTAHEMC